jgi:hypothetical protein
MIPFSPRKGAVTCVVCFFHFQRTTGFGYFKKKKRKKKDCFGYVKKIRIKEPAGSGYFKTLKEPSWDEERLSMNEI